MSIIHRYVRILSDLTGVLKMMDNFINDLNSPDLTGFLYCLNDNNVISMGIKIEKVYHEDGSNIYFSRQKNIAVSKPEDVTSEIKIIENAGFNFNNENVGFIVFNHCNYQVIFEISEETVNNVSMGNAMFLNFKDRPYIFSHTWLHKRYKEFLEQVMKNEQPDELNTDYCNTNSFKI